MTRPRRTSVIATISLLAWAATTITVREMAAAAALRTRRSWLACTGHGSDRIPLIPPRIAELMF
jgi:hypothetical protein